MPPIYANKEVLGLETCFKTYEKENNNFPHINTALSKEQQRVSFESSKNNQLCCADKLMFR